MWLREVAAGVYAVYATGEAGPVYLGVFALDEQVHTGMQGAADGPGAVL